MNAAILIVFFVSGARLSSRLKVQKVDEILVYFNDTTRDESVIIIEAKSPTVCKIRLSMSYDVLCGQAQKKTSSWHPTSQCSQFFH
jgi:hypothetical protein